MRFRILLPVFLAALGSACATTPAPEAPVSGGEVRTEGALRYDGVPAVPDALVERMRQYRAVRAAALRGWLPDGRALVSTRFGETSQVHLVDAPGAARRQLTFFAEPVTGALPSPDPERPGFLYGRDQGGSELYQVYFYDLAAGTSTLLTDGASRNRSALWSPDGSRIAYASTRRNGVDTDVWVGSLDPRDHVAVTEAEGSWAPVAFSPDGHRLIVRRYVSRSESRPWVVNLLTGSLTPVIDPAIAVRVDDLAFGPDGRSIYLTSDLGGEYVRLYRLDAPGAEPVPVTGEVPWDVESFELSPDGRLLAWAMNEEARSRLYLRDLQRGSFVALPQLPGGVIQGLAFTADSRSLGFTLNGATSPSDVHAIDLASRRLVRWTESEVGGLDRSVFVEPEHFRYETFDAVGGRPRTIPAFVYRPRDARTGPRPVIVSIHGGPEGQARPTFSSRFQYWVNELGAAVVVPNVRGSTGYGRSYHRLDDGMRREDSVQDIGALLDWIAGQPDLDASRVVVFGGSYGGYMVLAAMTLFPERIAAGVETVGISNFVTFLENTRDYRRDLRREEYGDERDPAMRAHLEEISPLGRVDRIDAPLLVMQGANDPRVPASESEQIVREVRAAGKEVWYLLAADEGHGFRKRGNQDAAAAVTALFLEAQFER